MRTRIVLIALLGVAASRGECGRSEPWEACAGKACGEACTVCPPDAADCAETAVVKACDPQGRCVPATDGLCGASASCAGKACGADCVIDPPCRDAVPPCMMPSAPGHCDRDEVCVPGDPPPPGFCVLEPPPVTGCGDQPCGTACRLPCPSDATCDPAARGWCAGDTCSPFPPPCPPPPIEPVTSCEGQACGVRCELPCPPLPGLTGCGASPPDAVCDGLGHCLSPTAGPPPPPECYRPPPSWGCVGKACGDPCGVCPEGTDPARCPVPTFAATACDMGLQCVTVGTFTCSPDGACRGKACGDACDLCGGACMHPVATACGHTGMCVPVSDWLCHDPCAGKVCGERCEPCPPGATDCAAPTVIMACDPRGFCVSDTGVLGCPP